MMEISTEMMTVGVTVGLAGAGVIGGMLRWSIVRNIETLDEKMEDLKQTVSSLASSLAQVREDGVTGTECSACRIECAGRHAQYQNETLGRMQRQEDRIAAMAASMDAKFERLILMVAKLPSCNGDK